MSAMAVLPSLRKLRLVTCEGLSDESLLLLSRCVSLASLNVAGCFNVGGVLALQSLAGLPRLRLLDLSFCALVTETSLAAFLKASSAAWNSLYGDRKICLGPPIVLERGFFSMNALGHLVHDLEEAR